MTFLTLYIDNSFKTMYSICADINYVTVIFSADF